MAGVGFLSAGIEGMNEYFDSVKGGDRVFSLAGRVRVWWHLPLGLAGFALALAVVACLVALRGWPVLAFALGNAVLLDRSKETQFCVSCHIMQPIYDSTRADDGSIASLHVTRGAVPTAQSCTTCHSGYGMWGDVGAKLSGVQHMLHTVTGRYDLPLKLYQPYDIDGCLQCHAESTRFRAVEVHATPEIQGALLSREMSCTGSCHPAAHPAEALSGNGSGP